MLFTRRTFLTLAGAFPLAGYGRGGKKKKTTLYPSSNLYPSPTLFPQA